MKYAGNVYFKPFVVGMEVVGALRKTMGTYWLFFSASDHRSSSARTKGSFAVMGLVLVLYQLSLALVGLVAGFFKERLQEGTLCMHSLGTQHCHPWLGCLLLVDEEVGGVLCVPCAMVRFLL